MNSYCVVRFANGSIFEKIFELPPGHMLIAESGDVVVKRYYQPQADTSASLTERDAIEKIREQSLNLE